MRIKRLLRRVPALELVMLCLAILFVSPCTLALLNSFKTLPEILQSTIGTTANKGRVNLDPLF